MGVSQSKIKEVSEVLNQLSLEVMSENSTAESTTVLGENELNISGQKNVKISNIKQINYAKINVSALQTSVSSGKLQSDLMASLTSKIKQEGAELGVALNDTDVHSVVSNSISSKITSKNLMNIQTSVVQKNKINITDNMDTTIKTILQQNEFTMLKELVSNMTTDIIAGLTSKADIKKETSQENKSFITKLADTFAGLGKTFLIVLGLGIFAVVIIIIIVISNLGKIKDIADTVKDTQSTNQSRF